MFQMQFELHTKIKNEEIDILITKHNLQQGIQHPQISNKSPNHSQHHTRKYTNFVRLTKFRNPLASNSLTMTPELEPSSFGNFQTNKIYSNK